MPDIDVSAVLNSPWFLAGSGVALGLLLVVWLVTRLVRLTRRRGGVSPVESRRVDTLLTAAAALIATGVAATGMWRFFGDVLHIESMWLRGTLFAFLEVALIVSAIRARRHLLDDLGRIAERRRAAEKAAEAAWTEEEREAAAEALMRADGERASTGVDGIAVWALATMSGVFAAMDARSIAEGVFRLAAPLVAAWLWERGMATDRRRARGGSAINWRITPERVLVKLGLAEPTGRGVGEVDRARRLARLARTAYRLHTLRENGAAGWRIAIAARRLRRQTEAANEHLGLARDPKVREALRLHLAVLYQADAGTSPAAVTDLAPWGASARPRTATPATTAERVPAAPDATALFDLPVEQVTESEQRELLRGILRLHLRPEDGHLLYGRGVAELAAEYAPQVPGLTVERATVYIEELFAEIDRWLHSLPLEKLRQVTGPGEYIARQLVREREASAVATVPDTVLDDPRRPTGSGTGGGDGLEFDVDARSAFPELYPDTPARPRASTPTWTDTELTDVMRRDDVPTGGSS